MSPAIAPVTPQERMSSLDMLRGVAVLGILLMNIASFGLPEDAYGNPAVAGGATGLNLGFWFVNQILFEGKMRCIFSMLFGAGSYLLLERAEERGAGLFAADIYYRRLLWLILFGAVHAYLIWFGDILFYYGVVGLTLLPFRRMSPKGLFILGSSMFLILTFQTIGASFAFSELRTKAEAATALEKSGKQLTAEQKDTQKEWTQLQEGNWPKGEELKKEIDAHQRRLRRKPRTPSASSGHLTHRGLLSVHCLRRFRSDAHRHWPFQAGSIERDTKHSLLREACRSWLLDWNSIECFYRLSLDGIGMGRDRYVPLYLHRSLVRPAFSRTRAYRAADADLQIGVASVSHSKIGRRGPDGVIELPHALRRVHSTVQRVWTGPLQQAAAIPASLCRSFHLGSTASYQPDLAAALSIWSRRVAMAFAHLLA